MRTRNEFKAGLFVITAMLLFTGSIFIMGRERQIFARQTEYTTSFKDVKGLSEGAPVRLGGISIGRVAKIDFGDNVGDPHVYVTLLINDKYRDRLRPDSKLSLQTQGLLGDRFVSISAGTGNASLPPGSDMVSVESTDLGEVANKLTTVVDTAAKGVQSIADAGDTFRSLMNEVKSSENGGGVLHQLIYADKKDNEVLSLIKNLGEITKQIKSGDGILSALINGKNGDKAVTDLTSALSKLSFAAESIKMITERLTNGPGMAHSVLFGENKEGFAELLNTLNETSKNLKIASESLANGSGSLGALLIDPTLYNNLMEITDKAKRSMLLKQAIRISLDK